MDQAEKDRQDAERWRCYRSFIAGMRGISESSMDDCVDRAIAIGLVDTTEPLLVAPPLTMCKAESTLKFSLNQCVDDYDLTSNDTRRGD